MGHDHGHGSHGHGAAAAGVIPEGSLQDKTLTLIAFLVMVFMTIAGTQWSLSIGCAPPEMPAEHESEHHAE
ncbi:MAG: hypothetical protein K2Y22_11730 [Candidatus Obscuribacterales bacterium]|nr:hypothetical protein [Candidatus Obscuribacterales bacterium]